MRIEQRLNRVEQGNLGDYKRLKNGIIELREHFGSGYRIYCGIEDKTFIILLCGGDKSS